MRRACALMVSASLLAGAAFAQDNSDLFLDLDAEPNSDIELTQTPNPNVLQDITSVTEGAAERGNGALLRALDKTLGRPTDIELSDDQTVVFGRIAIRLLECRYPVDNPASDAFAHIQVLDLEGSELFNGWMIASSPALVALEHPRYDVWVLNCSTS